MHILHIYISIGTQEEEEFEDFQTAPQSGFADSGKTNQQSGRGFATFPPTSQDKNEDNFTDFKEAPSGGNNTEFANFKQSNVPSTGNMDNKLAALKALVQNKTLYTAKDKEEMDAKEKAKDDNEDDWDNFRSDTQSSSNKEQIGAFNDTGIRSEAAEKAENKEQWGTFSTVIGGKAEDVASAGVDNGTGGGGWADFASAGGAAHPPTNNTDWTNHNSAIKERKIDWAPTIVKSEPDEEFSSFESGPPIRKPDVKNNQKSNGTKMSGGRRYDYFGRNLEVGVAAGTGMSPLDTLPPDMPEMGDEEEDGGFDKFGTFQGSLDETARVPSGGISTLTTPYGGLEDFGHSDSGDMFTYNSQRVKTMKDTGDTVSTSSSEFTGWKSQMKSQGKAEDTISISSLDLKAKQGSKEDSPVGADSQSVSSLDFGTSLDPTKKAGTPGDDRSIASLELKVATSPEDGVTPQTEEGEGFGEFSSAGNQTNGFYTTPPTDSSKTYL